MPTSLFQYEMLPTTWFYLSSLLILAVFFRFNRLVSVRNIDVLATLSLTPGLVYLAMGSTFQGYLWLWLVGLWLFLRLTFDLFLRRRPLLEPNLGFAGLAFSCVASSAFMIPNLFINRGDACESSRAWRLEQIVSAEEEAEDSFNVDSWPGYRPFLRATQIVNKFFAPSVDAWRRAVSESRARNQVDQVDQVVEFFGIKIHLAENGQGKHRPATRAVQWAAGITGAPVFDFEAPAEDQPLPAGSAPNSPSSLNGLAAAQTLPAAPIAPSLQTSIDETLGNVAEPAVGDSPVVPVVGPAAPAQNQPARSTLRRSVLSLGDAALIGGIAALQLGICVAIVLIGKIHFGSLQTGLACGLFYLLLPYINQFSARLDHIAPALALLLAVLFYRRPVFSGLALGTAGSLVFYPFFLVPLWLSFYWKKGAVRFVLGFTASVLTLAVALLFIEDPDAGSYGQALASMFGRHSLFLAEADGLWEYLPRFYRIPLISLFGVFCLGHALWTPRKNLATLLSCSAALMLFTQLWMGRQGGLYMGWYLPLLVLTIFRPNLEDRVATTVVADV